MGLWLLSEGGVGHVDHVAALLMSHFFVVFHCKLRDSKKGS